MNSTLKLNQVASAWEIEVAPPWGGRNAAPYCAHAIPRGLAVIVFTDIVPHLCGEVLVIAMLFEHGDGSVERQDGRSKERNRCLVGWAAGLPRTPCFHVRREFM